MTAADSKKFVYLLSGVLIGEAVISQPLTGNIGNDLLGGISGVLFAAVLTLLTKWCIDKFRSSPYRLNRSLKTVLLLAVAVLSAVTFVICLLRFSQYAAKVMLGVSSVALPLISLAALALFAARKGSRLILKLGSVLFFLSAVMIVLMFAFSVPFIETKYLYIYRAPETSGFLYSFISVGGTAWLASVPMLFLGKNIKKRSFLWGYILGGGAIVLCLINTLGVFGAEFAATLNFPYSYAVSTASVGKIFSRMDPFLYGVSFFTCLLKCAVCLWSAAAALKNLPFKILFRKN